ncbi:MAG TPA: helix-hairpin-helix domain-containing protein [bacterium]|nr:helix-hairpin-helix domain-containing protein [bacterium]
MAKFTNEEKSMLAVIGGAALIGLVLNIFFSYGSSVTASEIKPRTVVIDINRAAPEELTRLPGVGPSYASAIIEYRERNGGFKSPAELMKVKGIGPKKFEKLKNLITVDE